MAETNGQEHETDVNGTGERVNRPWLTGALAYRVGREIEASGARNGDFWEYTSGKSDETIAMTFGVDPFAVAKMRKKIFGPLRKGPMRGSFVATESSLRSQVKVLERRVVALETTIAELLMRK